MTLCNKIFTARTVRFGVLAAILAGFCCTPAIATPDAQKKNCASAEYRAKNPDKCKFYNNTTTILGSATVMGGAAALIGVVGGGIGGGGGSASHDSTTTTQVSQPTLRISPNYNLVGADVDGAHLTSVSSAQTYTQNADQFNDIRLAYSLARGFTGAGTTIAVLDSGLDYWHGAAVTKIASGAVAPDAVVDSYKISKNSYQFISYREIGDVIASADNANVYNSSWSVPMRATEIVSRAQLSNITDPNFVNQISIAATDRDAIFVWAAGNDYDTQSSALSALPRVMPELNGHFINVVAFDSATGELAEYSNACGITQDYCITAPGSNIDTGDRIVSGTSFAAPIVSAAVAVIRQAYPYMSSTEITQLLFTTARDLGEPGVDAVYGHGMLDMERATRPVGTALVAINENTTQTLTTARVAAPIAHQIKSANVQFAFFDSFGRPFTTTMSNNIRAYTPGRAFERLRGDNGENKTNLGPLELGFQNKEFLMGDGFLKLQKNATNNFIGIRGNTQLGNVNLFNVTRLAMTNARTTPESMISDISPIYSTTVKFGAQYHDWTVAVAIPDAIIAGDMTLRTPMGRTNTGDVIYSDTRIDLATRPAVEYSVEYKMLNATFIDNPYGTDEFFIMARGKMNF